MAYKVIFSSKALKSLKRIDPHQARLILAWVEKNLENSTNPRAYGKALVGDKKGYWRYRVGDYRLLADIVDGEVQIFIINVGHRKEIYE